MVEKKKDTVINLNTAQSFQVMVITIHAHLSNTARPGTFGQTVRELLKLNNLPDVILPNDAPLYEIFGAINGLQPAQIPTVQVQPPEHLHMDLESEQEEDEIEVASARISDILPRPEVNSVRQKIELYSAEKDKEITYKDITPTPANSTSRESTKEEEILKKLEIRFTASQDERIPDSLSPQNLSTAIDRGRVKYLYRGVKIPEEKVLYFIKDGKITTLRNPIRRVDRSVYKKSRNGYQEREDSEKNGEKNYNK